MSLFVYIVFVVFITANAEDCFMYDTPLEKDMTLKVVQDKCKEKVETGKAADYASCVECTLGLVDSDKKTVNFERQVEFLSKVTKNEEDKKVLVKAVDECKGSAYNGDDKMDKYMACWREKLFKVCEKDERVMYKH